MRFFHIDRCLTCNLKLPKVGDGGDLGWPSASRSGGNELGDPFGAIYEGLAAANLMNEAMDKYLQALKKHRGHKLEQRYRDDPDSDADRFGPWKEASEARPSPDFLRISAAWALAPKGAVRKSKDMPAIRAALLRALGDTVIGGAARECRRLRPAS